jgi:hypothetical protein
MAYDENLANRIRELVDSESDLTEKKIFGGLAFLIGATWPWQQAAEVESWCA